MVEEGRIQEGIKLHLINQVILKKPGTEETDLNNFEIKLFFNGMSMARANAPLGLQKMQCLPKSLS